jgi:hypothetical protein
VNAYCVAGMVEMATAMQETGDPNAEQLQRQAVAYRDDLREAVLHAAELAPVTRMRDGTYSPYVPTRVYQRFRNFGPLRLQYYTVATAGRRCCPAIGSPPRAKRSTGP